MHRCPKLHRRHGVVHAHTSEPASWPNIARARRRLRTAAQESPGKGIHRDVHTTRAHQRFLCGSSSRASVAEQSPAAHSVASHHGRWTTRRSRTFHSPPATAASRFAAALVVPFVHSAYFTVCALIYPSSSRRNKSGIVHNEQCTRAEHPPRTRWPRWGARTRQTWPSPHPTQPRVFSSLSTWCGAPVAACHVITKFT